jgi:hypothetical protein
MHHKLIIASLLLALTIGCSSPTSQDKAPADSSTNAGTEKARTKTPPPPPESAPTTSTAEQTPPAASKANSTPEAAKPAPGMQLQQAEVGAGAKGHGYEPGLITTPVATYFVVKERLAFEVEIPHAMQLFKATENRAPRTQEEFMEKIIKENDIKLPELPKGHRYVYDPKTEQLMVERPK